MVQRSPCVHMCTCRVDIGCGREEVLAGIDLLLRRVTICAYVSVQSRHSEGEGGDMLLHRVTMCVCVCVCV